MTQLVQPVHFGSHFARTFQTCVADVELAQELSRFCNPRCPVNGFGYVEIQGHTVASSTKAVHADLLIW